jgi:SRSO17 transposase
MAVARQYSGPAGNEASYQARVSLTPARAEVLVLQASRMTLPEEWSLNGAHGRKSGVAEERIAARELGRGSR